MQEFFRLRSSLRAKQQHASLLDFRDFDRASFDVEEAADSSDQSLLKEQAAITRSTGQVRPLPLSPFKNLIIGLVFVSSEPLTFQLSNFIIITGSQAPARKCISD